MATDVDVQYFSHLNGLTLGNNWGDLVRLLDKALVTGVDFTQITAASIDAQGDVHITLYTAHNAMLFQVVELSGFAPASLNQKYRIKGVPSATELILKPHTATVETSIATMGSGKLASLGYEIIFRDTNDVKRVYRAKNPTAQHPFIRVDESLTSPDGTTGVYTSTYAKYAMVGLLEHMDHIDDFENPDILQLPFYPINPKNNWDIRGTGSSVIRGDSKWYYANRNIGAVGDDTKSPSAGNRSFTLIGDSNAFYLMNAYDMTARDKKINGCGIFDTSLDNSFIPNWFLMTHRPYGLNANSSAQLCSLDGGCTLTYQKEPACFFVPKHNIATRLSVSVKAYQITPDYRTGNSDLNLSPFLLANMTIPFYDSDKILRGTLKHILYSASSSFLYYPNTTPRLADNSMYVVDSCYNPNNLNTGVAFYLGELE